MKISYFYFITFCIYMVYSQKEPTLSYINKTFIRDIGDTAELKCSIVYAMGFPVLWLKMDKDKLTEPVVISTGSSIIIKNTRFSIRQENYDYILQIKDIQETDDGLYQCQLLRGFYNKISAEVYLQVRRPSIISDNSTKSLIVIEGESVSLNCYANGFPYPVVSWIRLRNTTLPMGGSIHKGNIMRIPCIKKEDCGTYCCIAQNGFGQSAHHKVLIEVKFGPVITIANPFVAQNLQNNLSLKCHIEAFPSPAIVWLKNGVQISNNQHYSIEHYTTETNGMDTILNINRVAKYQYGEYICKASNVLGSAEAVVILHG